MRSYIETVVIIMACGSALFWFSAAMCRLPTVTPGMNELDKAAELSRVLRSMSRQNFWASGLMGVTALLSALARFLGMT